MNCTKLKILEDNTKMDFEENMNGVFRLNSSGWDNDQFGSWIWLKV